MVKASQYTKPVEQQSRKQQERQTWAGIFKGLPLMISQSSPPKTPQPETAPPAGEHAKQHHQLGNTHSQQESMGYFRFKPERFFLKVPKDLLSSHNVKILCIWDGKKKDWTKARPKPSCTTIKSHSSMSRLRNTRCHRQSSKWFGYSHASGTATWSRYGCSLGLALFGAYSLGLILTVPHPVSFQRNSDHVTHCLDCEGFS